ncbi:MAG: hypothetical protein HC846_09575 [Blastocatellia bacterium]|nr:hypothetical protein [Blastocatellia bacterium]
METKEKEVLNILENEIKILKQLLFEVAPDWEQKTLEQFSNEDGFIVKSVCLPIRAAINLIKDKT